jgi:hypothetical protein
MDVAGNASGAAALFLLPAAPVDGRLFEHVLFGGNQ